MLPTLYSGDVVLTQHLGYRHGRNIRRGDCVMATSPHDPDLYLSKRVLALEGDVICVDPSTVPRQYIKAILIIVIG